MAGASVSWCWRRLPSLPVLCGGGIRETILPINHAVNAAEVALIQSPAGQSSSAEGF